MKPIAIFYHCLFYRNRPPQDLPGAYEIIAEQMRDLRQSGLEYACSHLLAGINGGEESALLASTVLPSKTQYVLHGLDSQAENLTLVELEKWVPSHPDWYVLYFHSKGATHIPGTSYSQMSADWRRGMMTDLVINWRQCVVDLDAGYESVGSHFMRHMGWDRSQHIWAGNFWWANSTFLATLPSIWKRERIKTSGIGNVESRYEAEVWIGNGPRPPHLKEYRPGGGGGVP